MHNINTCAVDMIKLKIVFEIVQNLCGTSLRENNNYYGLAVA